MAGLLILVSGVLAGPAQRLADDTLGRMVPPSFDLALGDTDVRLSWPPSLAVSYNDMALNPSGAGETVATIGRLAVQINPFSLVRGEPRISGLAVDRLRLDAVGLQAALPADPAPKEPFTLGAVPERFEALFASLRGWGAVHLHHDGGLRLRATDAEIVLSDNPFASRLRFAYLTGRADGAGSATVEGSVAFNDDISPFRAAMQMPSSASSGVAQLDVTFDAMPFPWRRLPTLFSGVQADHEPGAPRLAVATDTRVQLTHDLTDPDGHRLRLSLEPQDLSFKLDAEDFVPVFGQLDFDYAFENRMVELRPADWALGRTQFELAGAMRDQPTDGATGQKPAIEFELIANEGRLAPADSPERALPFALRARGVFAAGDPLITFTDIELATNDGDARGEGQISLDPTAPTAIFDIAITDMAVAALKQLWPAPVARGARRWVLANLAGGRVISGSFDIAEPLRRRVPETGERISGDSRVALDVEGARFDLTGDLPPVRDAIGRVVVGDNQTQLSLQSGTVYLPSGRTAEASEGTMVITPPGADGFAMADVDVRVQGSADALGEMIAYYPINAMQFYAYDPADLSGTVDARIDVRFALAPREVAPTPQWSVTMRLEDAASVAPIEGRALAGLTGTATVTPKGADLDVAGTLDGLPAELAMVITPPGADGFAMADVDVRVQGSADALGEMIAYYPINAMQFYAYDPADLSGTVDARIDVRFALAPREVAPTPEWSVTMRLDDAASVAPIEGRALAGLTGTATVTPKGADLDVAGTLDGLPAELAMVIPFGDSDLEAARAITLQLDDASRQTIAPGLDALLQGPTPVRVGGIGEALAIEADLTAAELAVPWIGWSKGAGIGARAAFDLLTGEGTTVLDDFELTGNPFAASGRIEVGEGGLQRARFGRLRLNEADDVAVDVRREGAGYAISVEGTSLDVRALIRQVRKQLRASGGGDVTPVRLTAAIGSVRGFGGATLRDVRADLTIDGGGVQALSVTGSGASGFPFSVAMQGQGADRRLRVEAFDAGEFLRFLDLYGQINGGVLTIDLTGRSGDVLTGPVRLVDFRVFDEPRLAQLVSSGANGGDSLNQAVRRDIDTREVPFDLAQGVVALSPGALDLGEGVARGPLVGFALQGRVFDADNRMRLTGTFMPAYGVNSLFGDIPLVGLILGNGRDRGLIGVTFKLEGPFDQPEVTVNPLSLIAPGVFRSIFEFR